MRKPGGTYHAFQAAESAAADRKIGQLMHITSAGEATTVIGDALLAFPLIDGFKYQEGCYGLPDNTADVQIEGVASVWVETFTGIDVGTALSIGTTGIGVKARSVDGEHVIGIALEKPTVNDQVIMVLLAPIAKNATIY